LNLQLPGTTIFKITSNGMKDRQADHEKRLPGRRKCSVQKRRFVMKTFRRWNQARSGSAFLSNLLSATLITITFCLSGSVALLAFASLGCVPGQVEGRVLDATTGDPIPEVVMVFGDGQDISVTSSNKEGQYTGRRTQVLLIKAGYATQVGDIYEQRSTDLSMRPVPSSS